MTRAPLTIGHRGACGEAPENTMASFRLALDQGAEMVELDVRLTRDGVPVLMHDATLGRTTSGHGFVSRTSWDRLRNLDAGRWYSPRFSGERVPDLYGCLSELSPRIPVNVEIKCLIGRHQPLCEAVVGTLRRLPAPGRFLVTSFHHRAVDHVHALFPEVPVGRLFHPLCNRKVRPRDLDWLACGEARYPSAGEVPWSGRALVVEQSMVRPELTRQVHDRGGALLVYTVNDPSVMRRMVQCEVDGVITNFPARFRHVLDGLHARQA
ncbi:MAG: glycerophosphodiester phosphodiesterase family protein [Candidatus Eremiobacterota bacterium]